MNVKQIPRALLSAGFAFLFSFGSVGCLVTAFDLKISWFGTLALLLLFSLVPPMLFCIRYGGWIVSVLLVQIGYWLWQDGILWKELKTFANIVSRFCKEAYDWPVIGEYGNGTVGLVCLLVGFCAALGVGLCVYFRRSAFWALPAVFLSPALCYLTKETPPHPFFLFLIFLAIALLFCVDWTQKKNSEQTLYVLRRVALPVIGCLLLLFLFNPREQYENRVEPLSNRIENWLYQLCNPPENWNSVEGGSESSAAASLDLRILGARGDNPDAVMTVTTNFDRTLYLRARDYDIYNGFSWEDSGNRIEPFPKGKYTVAGGMVAISTVSVKSVYYTPYYPTKEYSFINGALWNQAGVREYVHWVSDNPEKQTVFIDYSLYTKIPFSLYEWARPLAESVCSSLSIRDFEKARRIAQYVRSSASYDLTPEKMGDASDFTKWFLEEGKSGYCIHFASSAAVLLRAAGVPARYVEGYIVSCVANQPKTVTGNEAHAWVEYFDKDLMAWRILEATPTYSLEGADGYIYNPEQPYQPTPGGSTAPNPGTGNEPSTSPDPGTGNEPSTSPDSEEQLPYETEETEKDPSPDPFDFGKVWSKILFAFFCFFLLAVLFFLQGKVRGILRRKRWNRGNPNRKTLNRFGICRYEAKRLKKRVPEVLLDLALKAKYSQHTITSEELEAFDHFRSELLQEACSRSKLQQFLFRWVFAIGVSY